MTFRKATVVIPFLNAETTIEQCASSLLNQTYPAEKTQFLFVDNGSIDQSVKILKKFHNKDDRIRILRCTKPGSYAARNFGINHTDSEIIAFTDSDCVAHSKWLETLMKSYSAKDIGGVGGKLLPLRKKSQPDFYATYHWLAGVYEQSLRYAAGYIQTANASYRKEVLNKVQGYDEAFMSGGDADISWRVADAGYKVLYVPKAVIYHHPRRSMKSLARLFVRYGKGTAELEKAHSTREMMSDGNLLRIQLSRFLKMFTHPTFRPYRKYILPATGLETIRALAFLLGYISSKWSSETQKFSQKHD